jgi:ribosomal protein L7Ae-like RNA K-turn-binding protein
MRGSCLNLAAQKKQFSRGFKGEVLGGEGQVLTSLVTAKLEERIASYLSLANKGGKIVSGSDQVLEKLKKGGVGILFLATDISADIGEKFRGVAKLKGVRCMTMFTKERLGGLIGKELRSVLAVMESGFVASLGSEMEKYRNFFEEERE